MRQGGDRKGCVEGDPSGYREGQDSEVKGRGVWRGIPQGCRGGSLLTEVAA